MKKELIIFSLVLLLTFPSLSHAQGLLPLGGRDSFRLPSPESPEFCGCIPSPASQFPTIVYIPPSGPIMCVPPTPPLVPTTNFFDFFFGYTTGFVAVPFTPLLFPSLSIMPGQWGLGFYTPVSPVCGLIIPFQIPNSVGCGPFLCISIPLQPMIGTVSPNTGSSPPSLDFF